MSKIQIIPHGVIHALAFCDQCDWTDDMDLDEANSLQKLRYRISKHVGDTGHTIVLETGKSTIYKPNDSNERGY